MEYIDGITLTKFSKQHQPPILYKHLLSLLEDILPGLKYLHSNHIIHRDIKPDNIMIDHKNNPKLIDLGLACLYPDLKCA
ncbi:unnamed protein product, partial [marine sediment metagenome]